MKFIALFFVLVTSGLAFANPIKLDCVRANSGEGKVIEAKKLNVFLTEQVLSVKVDFFGKIKLVNSKFIKMAKNGSRIYDGGSLTELLDQADLGNIFVEPKLLAGKVGIIAFSVRQLGDSEGSWWNTDRFTCQASK